MHLVLRLTAGKTNRYKFVAKLWVKHCTEKTEFFDVAQEKLTAEDPEGCSKLLVKVCKVSANTYCDSGKEKKKKIFWKINGSLLKVIFMIYTYQYLVTGRAVAQLVEALRYKPEGRGFDWNFSLT